MDSETVKGKPLTKEESKFLLDLIEGSKIITSKTTNATNNQLKNVEWIRLAERFNAKATNSPRTPQQLRLKWENLKKNSRKRSIKIQMNQTKTDGGPVDYIPPDEILDRVIVLLGSTVSRSAMPFGGDKETETVGFVACDGEGGSSCDSDDIGDVRVSVEHVDETITPTPLSIGKVRKKLKPDENRSARNIAIAEYYSAKKQILDAKLINIKLENNNFKLRNLELKLNNEKLMLEIEKLKLELNKLKKQQ